MQWPRTVVEHRLSEIVPMKIHWWQNLNQASLSGYGLVISLNSATGGYTVTNRYRPSDRPCVVQFSLTQRLGAYIDHINPGPMSMHEYANAAVLSLARKLGKNLALEPLRAPCDVGVMNNE